MQHFPYFRIPLFFLSLLLFSLTSSTPASQARRFLAPVRAQSESVTPRERIQQADRLSQLGLEQVRQNQLDAARRSWQGALEIYEEVGDKLKQGWIAINLGLLYETLGDDERAVAYHQQSLEIVRELGKSDAERGVLHNLGRVYERLAEYKQAQQVYRQSLMLARQIGDRQGESEALHKLGTVYQALAEYRQAQQVYRQSLEISLELGDREGESGSSVGLGNVYLSRGEYGRSQQFYQRALVVARELGNRTREADARVGLGLVFHAVGEYRESEYYLQQALAISEQQGDRPKQGQILTNLGIVYESRGEYLRALQVYRDSLTIATEDGDRATQAKILDNLGTVYNHLAEGDRAEDAYRRSLAMSRERGDRVAQSNTLGNLGILYERRGDFDRAIRSYLQSLAIAREIGDRRAQANSLHNLGSLYEKLEQYDRAEQYLLESIQIREQLRPDLSDSQKITLFDQYRRTYERLQSVLIARDRIEKALEIAERGRARAFVELLARRVSEDFDLASASAPPDLDRIRAIARLQNAVIVQYSIVLDEFTVGGSPQWRESQLYIWVIRPTGAIAFRRVDLTPLWQQQQTSIAELIYKSRCFGDFSCYSQFETAGRGNQPPQAIDPRPPRSFNLGAQATHIEPPPEWEATYDELKQLYQLSIDPIADLLPTDPDRHVIFIPQDSLFLLPFPALIDENGRYLIEKHAMLTAPSIQVLEFTRQQSEVLANREVLIVGNPEMPLVADGVGERAIALKPLPYAEREAREIGQILQATPLIGKQATETAVVEQMQTARLIHLATHGSFDPQQALDSWIALTPSPTDDGLLTAAEIFELDLNAELVVLSACETGRGKITGDGAIGLSRSLISAGVASVLVSLWSVPDDTTAVLMEEFYQHWLASGDKAQALRQAMLKTMAKDPNPYGWAAFTLIGEAE
jgi:CHAT domain-containing protein/tetratricopeptide (TPR) repeat protein